MQYDHGREGNAIPLKYRSKLAMTLAIIPLIVKCVITFFLLVFGVLLVLAQEGLEDLLLNALSLGFIIQVLRVRVLCAHFRVCSPLPVRTFMQHTDGNESIIQSRE